LLPLNAAMSMLGQKESPPSSRRARAIIQFCYSVDALDRKINRQLPCSRQPETSAGEPLLTQRVKGGIDGSRNVLLFGGKKSMNQTGKRKYLLVCLRCESQSFLCEEDIDAWLCPVCQAINMEDTHEPFSRRMCSAGHGIAYENHRQISSRTRTFRRKT